jgi:aminopeptidase N
MLIANGATPEPGVSEQLAQERAANISSVRYNLFFDIPQLRSQPITGQVTVGFELHKMADVVLDFEQPRDHVRGVTINDTEATPEFINGHIVASARTMHVGQNSIQIQFIAGDEALNRSDDFLYTLFVPARARLTFPCFDQPDLKARYRLTVGLGLGGRVVTNGRQLSRVVTPYERILFEETEPLPTYLFGFAAGHFSVETAERDGREFRMFHRESDAAKVARNRDALFDLHAKALKWLEEYTGIPYPWGKFDFVLIPSFQFGGMEHPGSIFYNASSMMLDESATQNQLLNRASTISHETAHMWFGDLVTMRWFNDVWMKEVMANFMAAKIVNPSFPEVNHDLRFLLAYYPAAYDVDRTAGANPIRQELANLNEAGSLYGNIIYDKAPVVMRQLERIMGEQGFRDGLREYLKKYAFSNATWNDLIKILDDRTPEDLASWSHAWVEVRGRPEIAVSVSKGQVTLTQKDPLKRGAVWPQRFQLTVGYKDHVGQVAADLKKASVSVPIAGEPLYVLPTGGGIGYGGFSLDDRSRKYFLDHLEDIPDALTRASAVVVLWEEMLAQHTENNGRVGASDFVALAMRALPRETDEQNTQLMLEYVASAYWRFFPQEERLRRAPALDALLREGLGRARTTSLKSAWFRAFRSVAQTKEGVAWLRRLWGREEKIEGLPLSEQDEIALAGALAVREAPGSAEILAQQLARTKDPDRKARFQFVMPALSTDARVRAQAFERLRDVNNRRREPWALETLSYLNHPLHARESESNIRAALDLLPEIQRTGDIFFPKRWADSVLSGHRSAEAAKTVQDFLDRGPKLSERLHWVVLSSADELFRAAKR